MVILRNEIGYERQIGRSSFPEGAMISRSFATTSCEPGNPASFLASESPRLTPIHRRTTIGGVLFKVANVRSEREAAFRLVYDAYVRRGLMEPNEFGMRVTPHHLLMTTNVYVAVHAGQVISTMALICDDALGLPLETLYPTELAHRRLRNRYLAEVSCLASVDGYFDQRRMVDVFLCLLSLLIQSARALGVEQLVVAVHPRHARFYQRLMGCRQFGELKPYECVRGNPAVALEHDFARLDREPYPLYDRIYGVQFAHWELLHQPMSPEDREYFSAATEVCGPSVPIAAV
jgi:hypothetical protein